jgi:hypothetical protein
VAAGCVIGYTHFTVEYGMKDVDEVEMPVKTLSELVLPFQDRLLFACKLKPLISLIVVSSSPHKKLCSLL